jgi:hypothetical protein
MLADTPVRRPLWPSAVLLALCADTAWAQGSAPPPPTPSSPAPPPSQAELDEIQRALKADKAAVPAPPPAPPPQQGSVGAAAAALNPQISFIGDFALAVFSQKENLQAGGHDPTQTGFNLQALELAAGADVDPYFTFNTNIVFLTDEVELEEAYATTTSLPGSVQVRAGQFLTRFGRINTMHPHAWDFVDQPLVIGKMLGPDGNRGLGIELSWLTPLPWYVEVVLSETMAAGECCARSFYADDDQGVESLLDLETMLALKQFHALSSDWSLGMGVSGAAGPNPSAPNAETYLIGGDLYLKYRPISRESPTIVSLQAEGITRRRETPSGLLTDVGLYAQLFWRFAQRWATAGRYDFVTGADNDPLDPDWVRDRHRASAALTFYPTEFSRLRLQGSVDVPRYLPDPIYAAVLALEVAVGAHGAHPF